MNTNEKVTDIFISELLKNAEINFVPNGGNTKEVQEALKSASKSGSGNVGFPEFTAKVNDFLLVIEDKASLEKQANYDDKEETILATDTKSIKKYAENGALHYAQEIVTNTTFEKVFAFGCTGDEKHHKIRPIFVE